MQLSKSEKALTKAYFFRTKAHSDPNHHPDKILLAPNYEMLELLNETAEIFLTWSKNLFYLLTFSSEIAAPFFSDTSKNWLHRVNPPTPPTPPPTISASIFKVWHHITSWKHGLSTEDVKQLPLLPTSSSIWNNNRLKWPGSQLFISFNVPEICSREICTLMISAKVDGKAPFSSRTENRLWKGTPIYVFSQSAIPKQTQISFWELSKLCHQVVDGLNT